MAFAPDGTGLASGGSDGVVMLWDVASARRRGTLIAQKGEVRAIAFARDGRTLATGGFDGIVRLWDVATGRESVLLRRTPVSSVAFTPDGTGLVTVSDRGVQVWDVATRQARLSLKERDVRAAALAPDGQVLVTVGNDVRWWDPVSFLGRIEHGVAMLNAFTGASLVTAGVQRLGTPTRSRLAALWAATFLLVHATSLLPFVLPVMLGIAFGLAWASRNWSLASPSLVWLAAALLLAATVLVVSVACRRRMARPAGPVSAAPRSRSWLSRSLRYGALAALGAAAWFLGPRLVAQALRVRGEDVFVYGLLSLTTSPIGLVVGILAGLWADARGLGPGKARRYAIAVLVLVGLPALGTAVLVALGSRR